MNAIVAWKIYAYEPPKHTVLEALLKQQPGPQFLEYKDFISIMLTGLSAMLTALGIGLATVAIWGYSRLNEDAKAMAKVAATEAMNRERKTALQENWSVGEAKSWLEKQPTMHESVVKSLVDAIAKEENRKKTDKNAGGDDASSR